MMTPDEQQFFCKTLAAQAAHYTEILALSKVQGELIAEAKILDLFPVFTKISNFMKEVTDLDQSIVKAKESWETDKHTLPEEQREAISQEIEKIGILLKEILSLERTQQASIGEQQKRNRKDVTTINRGEQVAKAYGQAHKPPPKMQSIVDRRT